MDSLFMSILAWIMFGLIVGIVPKLLILRRNLGGMIITTMLGIIGALIGGFIGLTLEWYWEEDLIGSIMAVIGAMAVLFVYRQTAASYRQPRPRKVFYQ